MPPGWRKRWRWPKALYFGSSGASQKGGWTGFSKTYPKPIGTGSWTTVAKPTSSRWPALNRRKGMNTGPLRLLAGKVVELGLAPSLSHETVRLHLKKNALKPWQKQEWCIPKVSAEFVAHPEAPPYLTNGGGAGFVRRTL